jgi:hypothetical protein
MSIFFPDNDKRHDRLIQLSTDAQGFLAASQADYAAFKSLVATTNGQIAELYRRAGLPPPPTTAANIFAGTAAAGLVAEADTIVEITNVVVGVAGLVVTVQWMAPAATAFLVESGVLGAETATTVLGTVLGTEIVVGTLAGGIVGGLIVGAVVVAVGLIVDAIEGAILRDKLREGIRTMDQVRASCKLAQDKARCLVESLQAINRTLTSIVDSSVPVTPEMISNLVTKAAQPAIDRAYYITMSTVVQELRALDRSRGSWTAEDVPPADTGSHPGYPAFVVARVRQNPALAVPAGLKVTCLSDPNRLDLTPNCPVVQVHGHTIWPFSFYDNRVSMALVAYDSAGKVVGQWVKDGARYIVDISVDVLTGTLTFRGQANDKVTLAWSELAGAVA